MAKSWWEKKVNLSSKIWKDEIRHIVGHKQNVQLVQTSYINELNCSCFCHIINILLTELSRSLWENLDLGRVYRPHCVRSVLTTSVKILPYRPPARLIRANYSCSVHHSPFKDFVSWWWSREKITVTVKSSWEELKRWEQGGILVTISE